MRTFLVLANIPTQRLLNMANNEPLYLQIEEEYITLKKYPSDITMETFNYTCLRSYQNDKYCFGFKAGRRIGEGQYLFLTPQGDEIKECVMDTSKKSRKQDNRDKANQDQEDKPAHRPTHCQSSLSCNSIPSKENHTQEIATSFSFPLLNSHSSSPSASSLSCTIHFSPSPYPCFIPSPSPPSASALSPCFTPSPLSLISPSPDTNTSSFFPPSFRSSTSPNSPKQLPPISPRTSKTHRPDSDRPSKRKTTSPKAVPPLSSTIDSLSPTSVTPKAIPSLPSAPKPHPPSPSMTKPIPSPPSTPKPNRETKTPNHLDTPNYPDTPNNPDTDKRYYSVIMEQHNTTTLRRNLHDSDYSELQEYNEAWKSYAC